MARLAAAALLAAGLVASAGRALAQSATGALAVRVLDEDGAPGAGAAVEVEGPEGSRRAVADSRGQATVVSLRPGRWVVRASLGLRTAQADLLVGMGGTARIVLRLPRSGESPPLPVPSGTFDRATLLGDAGLRDVPRPADPWSLARDVPGILVDRVDVGGSDTAQQSLVMGRGDPGRGAVWTIDGVDVTDAAAVGAASFYPDMDALALVDVRTSALDVRVRTPGAQFGLVTRETAARWTGRAHVRATGPRSRNLPAALAGHSIVRGDTERVSELGGEAGGPVRPDRLWVWAAFARDALRQETFTGHEERLGTTDLTARVRARLGAGTVSLLALRAEKVDEDRDVSLQASPASRWRQSGPTRLVALEDRRDLGSVSFATRASYLDAGFRLDPQGGTTASAYEDFRGVFQRSYQTFDTHRPRFETGIEATAARRGLGFDHVILGGGSFRRSVVSTESRWPGNEVLGYERQTVFFRAFDLTGFAVPTRAQSERSVHGGWTAYAQDEARRGRLGIALGLRLERLSGRNLPSSVEADPAFPDLLPAVAYAGSASEIRWRDLLPRAGISWDLGRDGAVVARLGYAAYAGPLGAGEVTFDDPLGSGASLTYYWIDRNGNHTVEPGELDPIRGLLAFSGVDPTAPALARTPNALAPGQRAPRTHEVAATLARGGVGSLHAVVQVSWRRLVHPLWRPLRGLAFSDYVIRGAVQGELFGQPYEVGYYAPASLSRLAPGNGRLLANREGYHQDTWTAEAAVGGRVGGRLHWEASASAADGREYFPDPARSVQDPTPLDTSPLQDAGLVVVRPGGLGREDVFASARWTAGGTVRASLPWRVGATARVYARQGFPVPYFQVADTGDPTAGAKDVLVAPHVDSFRLPTLALVDARLQRALRVGPGALTLAVDAFNLLNRATTLQVTRDVDLPSFARARDLVHPRIVRFDLEYRF